MAIGIHFDDDEYETYDTMGIGFGHPEEETSYTTMGIGIGHREEMDGGNE